MARREVVLETRNLAMHFGGVRAVDNVDFELREKELRCLIGPNGAGKSTFFKCLTGQLTPTSGDVVIRDIPMTGREPHAIAGLGVGIKTQVPNLFDGLSAYENLWLSARRWHGDKRASQLVKETIERLELGEIRSAIVGKDPCSAGSLEAQLALLIVVSLLVCCFLGGVCACYYRTWKRRKRRRELHSPAQIPAQTPSLPDSTE